MPQDSQPTDNTAAASSDPVDEIASLLMGDGTPGDDVEADTDADNSPEQTQDTDDVEDLDDEDTLSDEPTEDEEEVDESENDTEDEDQDLATMLGLDESQLSVEDDGDFKINVKVDGEQGKVSLKEIIKGYQSESSNTKKSMALANERKTFETQAAAKVQEVNQSLERNQNLAKILEQEIMADYEKVDWDDLRQYDPAEWTARRQEFSTKYNKIQRLQGELTQQGQQVQQENRAKMNQQNKVHLKGQWDKMLENNPTWSDKAKYNKDMGTLRSFAEETYGYEDADFSNVTDARAIEILKDAQAYRKGAKVAQKKIKSIPKKLKRGKGGRFVKNKVSKLDKLTQAAAKATGANKRDLQTSAVAELLTGGI